MASLDGHTGNITALAYSAQGKWVVTGSEDGTVKVWDTRYASLHRSLDLRNKLSGQDCTGPEELYTRCTGQ